MRRRNRKIYVLTYLLALYIEHVVSTRTTHNYTTEKTSLALNTINTRLWTNVTPKLSSIATNTFGSNTQSESSKPTGKTTKDPASSLQSANQPTPVQRGTTFFGGSVSTQTPTPDNSDPVEEKTVISPSFSKGSTIPSSNSKATTPSSTATQAICEPAHQVDIADKRQIFESCENDTHCVGNLTCDTFSKGRKCYCSNDNQFFNGRCLRVNIPINASCQEHFQCAFYGEETFCSSEGFCTAKMKERNKTCDEENRNLTYWISAWVFEGIACFLVGVICTTGILRHAHKSKRQRIKRNSKNGGSLCREYSIHGNKQQVPSSSIYCELTEEIILTSHDTNTQSNDEVIDDVYNHLHEAREDNLISDNVYGIPNPQEKKLFLEK